MTDTIKTFNNKVLSAPYMLDTLKTVVGFFVNLLLSVVSTPICFIPEMSAHHFSKLNNNVIKMLNIFLIGEVKHAPYK
jgi:hypothetical protein